MILKKCFSNFSFKNKYRVGAIEKKFYRNLWDYFYLLYMSTRDCPPLPDVHVL